MGIFNFFKKKPKQEETEEIVIEKLEFSQISPWVDKKLKKNTSEEEKAISLIKETIKQFTKELKERISVLQEVNVDEKKSQDHYKTIVKDSREKYIEMLEKLFERLDNIEEPKLKDFIDRVNKVFLDFDKNSYKNYERATILIGKEMAAIKDTLKVFSKELVKTFEEKRPLTSQFNNLAKIKEKINQINLNKEDLENAIEESAILEKRLQEKEKQHKNIEKEKQDTKKSKDYLENLSNKRKIESLEDDLKKALMNLKQLIDFKSMASFFHINAKQMETVKEHREDFQTNFQKDSGNSIIMLLDEAKLNNKDIIEKTHAIKQQIQELKENKQNINEDPTLGMQTQLENLELEIKNIKNEQEKTQSREVRSEENKQELFDSLKDSLKTMNVEII
jgi:hypothetical protein